MVLIDDNIQVENNKSQIPETDNGSSETNSNIHLPKKRLFLVLSLVALSILLVGTSAFTFQRSARVKQTPLPAPSASINRPIPDQILSIARTQDRQPTIRFTINAALKGNAVTDLQNFLGIEGTMAQGLGLQQDDYLEDAWKQVILGTSEISFFDDSGEHGVKVERDESGGLAFDFSGLDKEIDYIKNTLKTPAIFFQIGDSPLVLSSKPDDEAYSFYAPADYDEWFTAVETTVRHIREDLNMVGASYMVWHEPETYYYWRGKPERRELDPATLDDYLDLYVTTAAAVKTADPTAKVGGPMTVSYTAEHSTAGGAPWGMDDFLRVLSEYNATYPKEPAPLDEVIWQYYAGSNNERLAEGVNYLRKILPKYGFPSDTPQVVVGWNRQFVEDTERSCERLLPQERSAHLASNILEQLASGGLARAYIWPFEYDYDCLNLALVTVPRPAEEAYDHGGYGSGTEFPNLATTQYCKRPGYAVLEILRKIHDAGGSFLTINPQETSSVYTLASSSGEEAMVVLTNNSAQEQTLALDFQNLPFIGNRLIGTLQLVDTYHSSDCNGLEAPELGYVPMAEGTAELSLTLTPYATALVVLQGQ